MVQIMRDPIRDIELATGGFGDRSRIVRINALDTEWGVADAEAVAKMDCQGNLRYQGALALWPCRSFRCGLPLIDGGHLAPDDPSNQCAVIKAEGQWQPHIDYPGQHPVGCGHWLGWRIAPGIIA